MVQLGETNSRMKYFYDMCILMRLFEFDYELLKRAVKSTFERRAKPTEDVGPLQDVILGSPLLFYPYSTIR